MLHLLKYLNLFSYQCECVTIDNIMASYKGNIEIIISKHLTPLQNRLCDVFHNLKIVFRMLGRGTKIMVSTSSTEYIH